MLRPSLVSSSVLPKTLRIVFLDNQIPPLLRPQQGLCVVVVERVDPAVVDVMVALLQGESLQEEVGYARSSIIVGQRHCGDGREVAGETSQTGVEATSCA